MLSDSLRARLEALNREPMSASLVDDATVDQEKAAADDDVDSQVAEPENLARVPRHRGARERDSDAGESLEELVPGRVVENAVGPHYLVSTPLGELWPDGDQRIATYHERVAAAGANDGDAAPTERMSGRRRRMVDAAEFRQHFAHAVLFLDLETCGFSGSPLFLVGVVRVDENDRLVVDQLLARDYTEERAVLESLWQLAAENHVLVTFNGKTFDWPMVHDRSTFHRLGRRRRLSADDATNGPLPSPLGPQDTRPHLAHIDVLHHARRRWRRRLPNCKLQTLERYVCRRRREDDIPGSQVPAAYHQFVRTGDAWQLRSILQHNALDLVTLVQLSMTLFMPSRGEEPERV